MKWHLTKDKLPEENRLVIIYIPKRPWIWNGSKGDIHYKVAWLVKTDLNTNPYCWIGFGPDAYRFEEVKAWTYFEEFDSSNERN